MKKQIIVEYGFISYTGVKWNNSQVDQYNAITKRIISFGDNVPESLLNGRHNLFTMFSTPIKEK